MQLVYSAEKSAAFAGMLANPNAQIYTAYNATRDLYNFKVVNATNNDNYTITINGTAYTYTSDASATVTEIRDGLQALIEAGSAPVTWTDVSTDQALIEGTDRFAALTISATADVTSDVTLTELVPFGQQIPFGRFICWDDRGARDECRLPRQSGDVDNGILGVAIGDSALETVESATSGIYVDRSPVPYVKQGPIWMLSESAITTVGAAVYVRYASGAGGSSLGAVRADDDTSTAAALTGASFRGLCGANELVLVEVNLPY